MWKQLLLSIFLLLFYTNCYAAITEGTNAGFCAASPSVDPAGATGGATNVVYGSKFTSPAGATTVNEIGWWCDNATADVNYEVGIYTHDAGNNRPNVLLAGASQTNAKGTTAGWKKSTGLSIAISGNTIYWIAMQLDSGEATNMDRDNNGAYKRDYISPAATLPEPWGVSGGTQARINALYAVYTSAAVGAPQIIMIM